MSKLIKLKQLPYKLEKSLTAGGYSSTAEVKELSSCDLSAGLY